MRFQGGKGVATNRFQKKCESDVPDPRGGGLQGGGGYQEHLYTFSAYVRAHAHAMFGGASCPWTSSGSPL